LPHKKQIENLQEEIENQLAAQNKLKESIDDLQIRKERRYKEFKRKRWNYTTQEKRNFCVLLPSN